MKKETVLHFHVGRGGNYNNPGFVTFCGIRTIEDVLQINETYIDDYEGEDYYFDHNGTPLISVKQAETGIGCVEFDTIYDTDNCIKLEDCERNDLLIILESNEYNREEIIKDYFDFCTDLKINWKNFNGNFEGLINDYFDGFFDTENFERLTDEV